MSEAVGAGPGGDGGGDADSAGNGLMSKARVLLQEVMTLQGPDAPSQAASIILKHLKCGNVSIVACTSRRDLFIRLSGQGMFPARAYYRSLILMNSDNCAAGLFNSSDPPPSVLYRTVTTAEKAATLPKDWEQEYHHSGMRTFLAVPIFAHRNAQMLGVLSLSSFQPGAFWESWWEPLLGIVAVGLVPLLQERLTCGLIELAMHVLSTPSIYSFVTAVLQRTSMLLESTYNKAMSVRLGLLSPDQESLLLLLPPGPTVTGQQAGNSGMTISCGSLADELRILHLPAGGTLLLKALMSGKAQVVHNTASYLEGLAEPCKDVFVGADDVVSSIVAAPLLTSCQAHSRGCSCCISQGRGIADIGYSSESCSSNSSSSLSRTRSTGSPRKSAEQQQPSSKQHPHQHNHRHEKHGKLGSKQQQQQEPQEPPVRSSQWYGCLYVAHQSPYDFEAELPAITTVSKMLTVLMMQCMPPRMAWRELLDLRLAKHSARHSASTASTISSTSSIGAFSRASPLHGSPGQSASQAADNMLPATAEDAEDGMLAPIIRSTSADEALRLSSPSDASPLSSASAPAATIATSSIVETLRRQVQRSRDRQAQQDAAYVRELQLHRLIGKGGFGTVYAGIWQGSPVAVKVMYVMQHERQLMKSAMEMAVLTSIQHPNIVRVYACLTDLVEEADPLFEGCCNPLLSVHYRPYNANSDVEQPNTLCNIVVMECCDRGNLHQAMRRGLLHKRLPNKGLVVDMRLLNTVLLQVAHSLQHLHEHGIIHSDVKSENVLIMSSSGSPIGFVCKLGDFGLVRLLMGNIYIRNRSGSGTVAYQAPEVFEEGSKLTPAVDVYAFGIMMYELYCCRRPYSGLNKETIARQVYRQRQRPEFPVGTWPKFQQLAERCWDPDADKRPEFGEIIAQLQELLDAAGGPFTCSSPLLPDADVLRAST